MVYGQRLCVHPFVRTSLACTMMSFESHIEYHHDISEASLGPRPSKNQKGGPGKQGGVKVYTVKC